MKLGYDGNAPEFREARDIEGKGKRERVLGPQNIKIDRLEWLLAHKRIEAYQLSAGRTLQRDQELAQIGGYASLKGGKGSTGPTLLPDAKCDAIDRVNAARAHVGNKGWRILELAVLENVSMEKAEHRMRLGRGNGLGMLIGALDCLAQHYGLASRET